MKRYISGSFSLTGSEKIEISRTLDKLERFDSNVLAVRLYFTYSGEQVKSITELLYSLSSGKVKKIIKQGICTSPEGALKKALKKVKKKMVAVVIKRAAAA